MYFGVFEALSLIFKPFLLLAWLASLLGMGPCPWRVRLPNQLKLGQEKLRLALLMAFLLRAKARALPVAAAASALTHCGK